MEGETPSAENSTEMLTSATKISNSESKDVIHIAAELLDGANPPTGSYHSNVPALTPSASSLFKSAASRRSSISKSLLEGTMTTDLAGNEMTTKVPHHRVSDKVAILERYDVGKKLGEGSFGKVRLLVNKTTQEKFAAKVVDKKPGYASYMDQLEREVRVMKMMDHPNVVKILEVFETPSKFYLIMEFCEGGELLKFIKSRGIYDENEVRDYVARILDVVAYIHDYGIVHRDLKPENILLAKKKYEPDIFDIKISDFGLVTFKDACNMIDNTAGTPFYMAPEVMLANGYSQQCDLWSVGVITYCMLFGFSDKIQAKIGTMIQNKKIEYPNDLWQNISKSALDFVSRTLQFDPAQRLTAREALVHPWILGESILNQDAPIRNVLNMMKSFNAERRLKKVFLTTWAVMCFIRAGKVHQERIKSMQAIKGLQINGKKSSPSPATVRSAMKTANSPLVASKLELPSTRRPGTGGSTSSKAPTSDPGIRKSSSSSDTKTTSGSRSSLASKDPPGYLRGTLSADRRYQDSSKTTSTNIRNSNYKLVDSSDELTKRPGSTKSQLVKKETSVSQSQKHGEASDLLSALRLDGHKSPVKSTN